MSSSSSCAPGESLPGESKLSGSSSMTELPKHQNSKGSSAAVAAVTTTVSGSAPAATAVRDAAEVKLLEAVMGNIREILLGNNPTKKVEPKKDDPSETERFITMGAKTVLQAFETINASVNSVSNPVLRHYLTVDKLQNLVVMMTSFVDNVPTMPGFSSSEKLRASNVVRQFSQQLNDVSTYLQSQLHS